MSELYGPEFFEGRSETVLLSASAVVPHVHTLLAPRSLLDVGCGKGEWLEVFDIEDSLGVDIAAPDGERFIRQDLNWPLMLDRTFDLVLSLEVGEHLPEASADTLVHSIIRHGRTVVFSAAVPGQEGKGHINCQPHEYWHDKFEARGYAMFDIIRPYIRHPDVSPWYSANTFAYVAR